MVKRNNKATEASNNVAAEINKADAIREYAAANPEATNAEIVKALAAKKIEVTTGRVSTILRKMNAKPAIDVETIKSAGAFVKSFKGEIEEAAAAIESVGGFVEACGSKDKALAALVSFKELSEALG